MLGRCIASCHGGSTPLKLENAISRHACLGRKAARLAIVAGRVTVDGLGTKSPAYPVSRFQALTLDGHALNAPDASLYLMLHKPVGVLSATRDAIHPTALDCIDHPAKETLHIAGRLDRSSSGLLLLTNDGGWSKKIMAATHKVTKHYVVETAHPIEPEHVAAFAAGFYFATENITTLPAGLEIIDSRKACVTLNEGRYHQIKRMFHRVQNRVVALHRFQIGGLVLDPNLASGEWRFLTAAEINLCLLSERPIRQVSEPQNGHAHDKRACPIM